MLGLGEGMSLLRGSSITFVAQSLITLATEAIVAFVIRSHDRCANVQFRMQRKVVDLESC